MSAALASQKRAALKTIHLQFCFSQNKNVCSKCCCCILLTVWGPLKLAQVVQGNMFIEKNGRNFVFGQPTIKGWSSVSPSRLIALTVSRLTAAKKCRNRHVPLFFFLKAFFPVSSSSSLLLKLFVCEVILHHILLLMNV